VLWVVAINRSGIEMVAVVSGNSLGLSLTSLATLGQQGAFGPAALGQSGEQTYVNVSNGNLVLQDQDDRLASTGLDAVALRTYNSQGLLDDDNGDNWTTGIFKQNNLQFSGAVGTSGSSITREDKDGAQMLYTLSSAPIGGSVTTATYSTTFHGHTSDTFIYNSSTHVLTWTDGHTGNCEVYDNHGVIQSATDNLGNTLTYAVGGGTVTKITAQSGESLNYTYGAGGKLTSIAAKAANGSTVSQRVTYGYDASSRLSTVTVDLSPGNASISDGYTYTTTYTYDGTSKRVASVTQADGTTLSFGYTQGADSVWRVTRVTDGANNITGYSYDLANRKTTVSDPYNKSTVYAYDATGQLLSVTAPSVSGAAGQLTSFGYDSAGNLTSVTDALNRTTLMTYDSKGNQLSLADAAGNTIKRTFDAENRVVTETAYLVPDPDGAGSGQPSQPLITRYVYDSATGNGKNEELRFVISPEGRVTEYRYDSLGQRTATLQYTVDKYDTSSLGATAAPTMTDMVGPAGTAGWVGGRGAQVSRTDVTLNFRGQLSTQTSWANVDANGNGVADGQQSITTYVYGTYDSAGRLLLKVTTPPLGTSPVTNRLTTYTYDGLGRVLSEVESAGGTTLQTTTHSYDAINNKITVTQNNGLMTVSAYDKDGRLISVLQRTATIANLGTTSYFYDADSQLKMTQDATGVRHFMFYDEAGRKAADVDGDGSVTEYRYNSDNLLTRTIRYAMSTSLATLVDVNGNPTNVAFASIKPAANALDINTWRVYDSANRLTCVVDGQGNVTQTSYDGASRVTAVARYATAVGASAFSSLLNIDKPSASNVAVAASADDRTSHNYYSDDGLLTSTLDAAGYLTEYSYDAGGRVYKQVRHAAVGANPPSNANDGITWTLYDAKGQVVGEVDAGKYLTESVYNLDGTLAQTIRYATAISATPAANSKLSDIRPALSSNQDRTTTWVYDTMGRVQKVTDPQGTATTYTYDAVGNLATTVRAAGQPEVRTVTDTYDAQGNLQSELVTGAGTTNYTYDLAGRRMSAKDPMGNVTLYFYDAGGQLTHTINALGEVTENQYNALGQVKAVVRYATRIAQSNLANLVTNSPGGPNSVLSSVIVASPTSDGKTKYDYDAAGQLLITTAPLGNLTTDAYDAFGELKSVTQTLVPGVNAVQNRVYDQDGRLAFTVDGQGEVVKFTYDDNGNCTSRVTFSNTLSASALSSLGSSNFSLASVSAAVQGLTDTSHDLSTSTVYDALGRALYTVTWTGAATAAVVAMQYDVNGNVTLRTAYAKTTSIPAGTLLTASSVVAALVGIPDAAHDISVRNFYDKDDRLIWSVDGTNAATQRVYDQDGDLLQVKQYATPIIAGSDPTVSAPATNAADRVTTFTYDSAGRNIYTMDALGGVVQNWYDANGNVTQRKSYATPIAVSSPPVASDLQRLITSSSDRVEHFAYDAANRLVYAIDGGGGVTESQYDAFGNLVKTIAYSTPLTGANLSPTAAPTAISGLIVKTAALDRTTQYAYNASNQLVYVTDSLGYVTETRYDGGGRITKTIRYAGKPTISANTVSVIQQALLGVAGAADRADTFAYYANGLLQSSVDSLLHSESYTYNGVGDKLSFINKNNDTWTYDYDAAGRMAQETSPAVHVATLKTDANGAIYDGGSDQQLVTKLTYDALGNLLSRTEASGIVGQERVTQYNYDTLGRQVGVTYPAVNVYNAPNDTDTLGVVLTTSTSYDALGNAVASKDTGGNWSYKSYDKLGRVTYETDAMGYMVHYARDAFGEVTGLTRYAALNSIAATPGGFTEAQAIWLAGNIANATVDRTILTSYDALGRASTITEPQALSYDPDKATPLVVQGSKVTKNTFDAFGDLVRSDDGKAVVDHFYDQLGQEVATIDPMGYLTVQAFDGMGNLKSHVEYAQALASNLWGGSSPAAIPPPAPAPNDPDNRTTTYAYDALGRKSSETLDGIEAISATTHYYYDYVGNLTRTVDAIGGSTYSYYDKLGRVTATVTPTVMTASGAIIAPLTQYLRDAFGNVLEKIGRAQGAAAGTSDPAGVDINDRFEFAAYDALGHLSASVDAQGYWHYFSYTSRGDLAKAWQVVTDTNTGVSSTIYQVMAYDALGHLTSLTQPAPAALDGTATGTSITGMTYDAFGEMTARKISLKQGTQLTDMQGSEYFKYDNAGRLWSTNSGNGVDRITLYDVQGRATVDIRSDGSGGSNVDVSTLTALQATGRTDLRKTVSYYDKAGHLIEQVLPQTLDTAAGLDVSHMTTSAVIVQVGQLGTTVNFDLSTSPAPGSHNQVQLSWTSLANLGSGDIKIALSYTTVATSVDLSGPPQNENQNQNSYTLQVPASTQTVTRIYTADQAASGGLFDWQEQNLVGGIDKVTGIVVYKKDICGNWKQVINQTVLGSGNNSLTVPVPTDIGTQVQLQARPMGSVSEADWITLTAINFGDQFYFDTSTLANGVWQYRTQTMRIGDAAFATTSSGTVDLNPPQLGVIAAPVSTGSWATGFYGWQSAGTGVTETFRYRVAGGTGLWASLNVASLGGGFDGVDASKLPAGLYDYELLYSTDGHLDAFAHATGQLTVQPDVGVRPIALASFTGNDNGTAVVRWPKPNTDVRVRYAPVGTSPTDMAKWTDCTAQVTLGTDGYQQVFIPTTMGQGDYTAEVCYMTSTDNTSSGVAWAKSTGTLTIVWGPIPQAQIAVTPSDYVPAVGTPPAQGVQFKGNADGSWSLNWSATAAGVTSRVFIRPHGSTDTPQELTVAPGAYTVSQLHGAFAPGAWDIELRQYDIASAMIAQSAGTITITPDTLVPPTLSDTTPPYTPPAIATTFANPADGSWSLSWPAPTTGTTVLQYRRHGTTNTFTPKPFTTTNGVQKASFTATELAQGQWDLDLYQTVDSVVRTGQALETVTIGAPPSYAAAVDVDSTPLYVPAFSVPAYPPLMPGLQFVPNANGVGSVMSWTTPPSGSVVVVNFRPHGSTGAWTIANNLAYIPNGATQTLAITSPTSLLTNGQWDVQVTQVNLSTHVATGLGLGLMTVSGTAQSMTQVFPPVPGVLVDPITGGGCTVSWDTPTVAGLTVAMTYRLRGSSGAWQTTTYGVNGTKQVVTIPGGAVADGTYDVLINLTNSAGLTSQLTTGTMAVSGGGNTFAVTDTTPAYSPSSYSTQQGYQEIGTTFTSSASDGSWSLQWPSPASGLTTTFNYRLHGSSSWSNFTGKIVTANGLQTASFIASDLAPGAYDLDVFQTNTSNARVNQFLSQLTVSSVVPTKATIVNNTPAAANLPEIPVTYTTNTDGPGTWRLQWTTPAAGVVVKPLMLRAGDTQYTDYSTGIFTNGNVQYVIGGADQPAGVYKLDLSFNQNGVRTAQRLGDLTYPQNATVPTLVETATGYLPPTGTLDMQDVHFTPKVDGSGDWTLSWPHAPNGNMSVIRYRQTGFTDYWWTIGPISTVGGIDSVTVLGSAQPVTSPTQFDLDLFYQDGSANRTQQWKSTITISPHAVVKPGFVGDVTDFVPGHYTVTQTTDASGQLHSVAQTFALSAPPINLASCTFTDMPDGSAVFAWPVPAANTTTVFHWRLSNTSNDWTPFTPTLSSDGTQQTVVVPAGFTPGLFDIELKVTTTATGAQVSYAAGVLSVPANATPPAVLGPITELTGADAPLGTQQAIVNRTVDRWGNLLSATDPRWAAWKTTYTYNAFNELISQTQPDAGAGAAVTTITHDALGRQTSTKDADGNVNGQQWDAAGDLIEEDHADGGTVKNRYDAFGDKTLSVTALNYSQNITVGYAYDHLGRLTTTTYAPVDIYHSAFSGTDGSGWQLAYQLVQDGTSVTLTETNTWDAAGRKIKHVATDGQIATYKYDLRGNVIESVEAGVTTDSAYDTQGHMTWQKDGNGSAANWTYDYFGQLTAHSDLGGVAYHYTYDKARQLTHQWNDRTGDLKLNTTYGYDKAGRMVSIDNTGNRTANGVVTQVDNLTEYAYDLAGNRIRERVRQGALVSGAYQYATYQDNHLGYDALGRLSWVGDARASVTVHYDMQGNRTEIKTHVITASADTSKDLQGETQQDSDYFFAYDKMNRQALANGDSTGNLVGDAHKIEYDYAGNKVSDKWIGTQVTGGPGAWTKTTGIETKETYSYDNMGRLSGIWRDNYNIDNRRYDAGGRLAQSGIWGIDQTYLADLYGKDANDHILSGNGSDIHREIYDADGRLAYEQVLTTANTVRYQNEYENATEAKYDKAGNLQAYRFDNYEADRTAWTYTYTNTGMEGYKQTGVEAQWIGKAPHATTVESYDGNGFLVGMTQSQSGGTTSNTDTSSYVNDVSGKALYANANGHIQRQLIANGEVLGRYGETVDTTKTTDISNPVYTTTADFSFGFTNTGGNTPAASETMHMVVAGDSLRSIAQAAYGDANLWYRIADANGLSGDQTLTAGQMLKVPGSVQVSSNNASIFKPYDPSKITGSTNPNLPQPAGADNCGGLGQVLELAVVIAVVYFTQQYELLNFATPTGVAATGATIEGGTVTLATTATYSAADMAVTGAIAGAAGSIAGQAVGNALGIEHGFSWKQVALGAIGGGVGGAFGGVDFTGGPVSGFGNSIARAAVGNALTQGIAVATGLQHSFDWREVAASAAGAGVGAAVGAKLSGMHADPFASRVLTGLAAGTTTALLHGGRVAVQQIATDAFGQALGSGFVDAMNDPGQQTAALAETYRENNRFASWAGQNASATTFMPEVNADGTPPTYDFGGAIGADGVIASAANASSGAGGAKLTMVPPALFALRDSAVLADSDAMRKLYQIAMDNSGAWLPSNMTPEQTSLTAGVAYNKVFGDDRTAIWFGLAPYATSKVGETYQQLDTPLNLMDRADTSIIRSGFYAGNRAIFASMFTAEQFYQAGGTDAVRAMVDLDPNSFGAHWNDQNAPYSTALVQSFELRDQAKAAFAGGQNAFGQDLLGQSLKNSADFEQRVVLQQYYDTKYTANDLVGNPVAKTLRQAMQDAFKVPEDGNQVAFGNWGRPGWNLAVQAYAEHASTVTINGQSLGFGGTDVGDVNQRMPFVYALAGNLMKTYGGGSGNWMSGSQRIYQEQFNVMQKTYGADAVFNARSRFGF
jgi:YD repeat-containing protein